MNKLILTLLLVTLLLSCTSTKKVMSSWVGDTKRNLILKWGPPAKIASDGGDGEILIYASQVYIPQYKMNYWDYKMFYANISGKIYHWRTERKNIPPTQIDLNIYRRY